MPNPDLFHRACRKYLRRCKPPIVPQQPDPNLSGIEDVAGLPIFVLRNMNGTLMAFFLLPGGRIERQVALSRLDEPQKSSMEDNANPLGDT